MGNETTESDRIIAELQSTIDKQQDMLKEISADRERGNAALQAARSRIMRAERLELASTVTAKIAHEFRNILAPILMLPPLIQRTMPEDDPNREHLSDIEQAAKDMVEMIEDLYVLAKRGSEEFIIMDLNELAEQMASMRSRKADEKNVVLKTSFNSDLLHTKTAPSQLYRVFQNLMDNAIEAVEPGGEVAVRTENVYLDEPVREYTTVRVGEYVKVTVSDSGNGIPQDIKEQIFDPFFTTKKTSTHRSSGLGLSIVHSVVKDHGGYINIETEEGKGTIFTLYFPTCRQDPECAEEQGNIVGGKEKLLIVDDDAQQIELLSRLLTSLGYRVHGEDNGSDAVEYLRNNNADLVILDMVMPRMNGAETFSRMKEINPDQKSIIVSGFSKSEVADNLLEMGAGAHIKKPICLEEIATAIRAELDR